jgi:CBS domain-containing protein
MSAFRRPRKVREFMARRLVVARPAMSVHEAMGLLIDHAISGLPVVDEHGGVVGIVTERDCLRVAYEASYHQDPGKTVGEVMTRGVETLDADTEVAVALERFLKSPYRRFPVLDGTQLVGQVSRRDLLRALRAS